MSESSLELLSEASHQVRQRRRKLVASKDIVPASVIREAWGLDFASFEDAVSSGKLLVLEVDGQNHLPAFYLHPSLDHAHLASVVQQLGNVHEWSKWQFFNYPKLSLGGCDSLAGLAPRGG